MVEVRLGPLPAGSAATWVAYAVSVLDAIQGGTTEVAPLDEQLVSAFRGYLAEWERAADAAAGSPFEWHGRMDRDTLADLATAWLELMAVVSGRVEDLGLPVGPASGEAFYHALVAAIGEALDVAEDEQHAERLGDKLREAWPGLGSIGGGSGGDLRAPRAPRKWRVAIADDSRDLRAVLRIALEQDGRFEVVAEGGDGAEAVTMCESQQPDIVLLDLVMPRVDGWSALATIRERWPRTMVIVVSTIDEALAADRAKALGAAAYVQKSISLVTLTETLAELAGLAEAS